MPTQPSLIILSVFATATQIPEISIKKPPIHIDMRHPEKVVNIEPYRHSKYPNYEPVTYKSMKVLDKPGRIAYSKATRLSGPVVLQIFVNNEGKTVDSVAVAGHTELVRLSQEYLNGWIYAPREINGTASPVTFL